MGIFAWFNKLKTAVKHPSVVWNFLIQKKYDWVVDDFFKKRRYRTYDEYVQHQQAKLKKIQKNRLPEYDVKYHEVLSVRLRQAGLAPGAGVVLCLAARWGTEVRAFIDHGYFAVGIDLNPGVENKYVVYGDFHQLQFADHSVDVIFTNSLDHALDLPRLLIEVRRVLKPAGRLLIEIVKGVAEGGNTPGYYESLTWEKLDDILPIFRTAGWQIILQKDFEYPWVGQQILFAPTIGASADNLMF